jgi:rSAM/selenodomain-associated transferase 1
VSSAVGLFAKAPRPGRVKTRLVPPLTHEEAAAFARLCLEETLRRFPDSVPARWTLFLDGPPEAWLSEIAAARGVVIRSQGEGDLGERLARAFRGVLGESDRAVMIGSDSPTLDPAWIASALARLESADVVLGPARDGGCWLIGARRDPGTMLEEIAWSSSLVCDSIRERARGAGATLAMLPEWYDLDEASDLERAASDVNACPALQPWIDEMRRRLEGATRRAGGG